MRYNPYSLENKTILVTGASSGIGRATAVECSKVGAKVILTARDEERLIETLSLLHGDGHSIILCDLEKEEDIIALADGIHDIQGLVNNAGFTKIAPLPFISGDSFRQMMDVNTVGPILLLRYLLKKKKLKPGASVVFTSSLAALGFTTMGNAMYAASKGAVSAFVANAALELSKKNIRVNAVCPGMVDTGILSQGTVTAEQLENDRKNYPLGRYGKPEEVAWAMIYLLSDASAWVTGTNMVIDGGYSIR